jgi:hypothetical protein
MKAEGRALNQNMNIVDPTICSAGASVCVCVCVCVRVCVCVTGRNNYLFSV